MTRSGTPLPTIKSLDLEIGALCATVPSTKLMLKYVHHLLVYSTEDKQRRTACRKCMDGEGVHNAVS